MSEFGYPYKGAQLVAVKLEGSAPELRRAFLKWWEMGELPELGVEGFTVSQLIDQHHLNPIAAFLTLDWLIRQPEQAKAALRKGHDHVTRPDMHD
jgi:hypothetical protein